MQMAQIDFLSNAAIEWILSVIQVHLIKLWAGWLFFVRRIFSKRKQSRERNRIIIAFYL